MALQCGACTDKVSKGDLDMTVRDSMMYHGVLLGSGFALCITCTCSKTTRGMCGPVMASL